MANDGDHRVARHYFVCILGAGLALSLSLGQPLAQTIPIPFRGLQSDDSDALVKAAAQNNTEEVQRQLSLGSTPDRVDGQGRTALIYAAMLDNAAMAKMLVDHGANVKAHDKLGNASLHWAAERGAVGVMNLLLAANAPVDDLNKQGITPLMMAAGAGAAPAVKLLLTKGADPKKQDFSGRDAEGWAAGKPAVLQVLSGSKSG